MNDTFNSNAEPRYSREWLLSQNRNREFVFFCKPCNMYYEPECCFCQWQYSEFTSNQKVYTCAEQYMMAEKARVFADGGIAKQIMKTSDPKKMKALGRKVKNFKNEVWVAQRYSVVFNGNYYKFTQNENMRDILLATKDRVLVEASPLDTVWGIGYSKDSTASSDPAAWRGLNLLEFALMEVRDEVKRAYSTGK
jgi:ribA/ribD-fused uncharacterized protein